MKNILPLSFCCLVILLSGCIVDVAEQSTERFATASGNGLLSVYFDATIYRGTFNVTGSPADTLIADGVFSLWAPGSSSASSIAQEVSMLWSIDTLHRAELIAFSDGPQKELLTIDRMSATIPATVHLKIDAGSTDISAQNMKGDLEINATGGDINFTTDGRMALVQSVSGTITGSSGLGGSVQGGSGDIDISLPQTHFESFYASDTTGNVTLRIATGAGVTFHLQTLLGNINLDYDGVKQTSISAINTIANGGGRVVTISTNKGNITVLKM